MARNHRDTIEALEEGFFASNRTFWREITTYKSNEKQPGSKPNPAAGAIERAYDVLAVMIGGDEIVYAIAEHSATPEDRPAYRWVVYTPDLIHYVAFDIDSAGVEAHAVPRRTIECLSVTGAPKSHDDAFSPALSFSAKYRDGLSFDFRFHEDPAGIRFHQGQADWLHGLLQTLKEDLSAAVN